MSKTIVSIISEQTIPNYLFIREMYLPGDSLLFISSDKFKARIDWIVNALDYRFPCEIGKVVFPSEGEERWLDMQDCLLKVLSKDKHYLVNLTGGTKYMSLLVQHVFEQFGYSEFAYIPYPKNHMLVPTNNEGTPLKYRISVREYMSNYNVSYTEKEVVEDVSYTNAFFKWFISGHLNFEIVNLLRCYRDKKQVEIEKVETCEGTEKRPQIKGLDDFIHKIHFPVKKEGVLCRQEIEYLTGGWFEEYIYHQIKEKINPQDIRLGVLIKRTESHNQNDLDVVFTYGNKLFVIECVPEQPTPTAADSHDTPQQGRLTIADMSTAIPKEGTFEWKAGMSMRDLMERVRETWWSLKPDLVFAEADPDTFDILSGIPFDAQVASVASKTIVITTPDEVGEMPSEQAQGHTESLAMPDDNDEQQRLREIATTTIVADAPEAKTSPKSKYLFRVGRDSQPIELEFGKGATVEDAITELALTSGTGKESLTLMWGARPLKERFLLERLQLGGNPITVSIKQTPNLPVNKYDE